MRRQTDYYLTWFAVAAEIASGFWFVRPADADVVFRAPTADLWGELVRRSTGLTARL